MKTQMSQHCVHMSCVFGAFRISEQLIIGVSDENLHHTIDELHVNGQWSVGPITSVVVSERPDIVFTRKDSRPLYRDDMLDVFKCVQEVYARNQY